MDRHRDVKQLILSITTVYLDEVQDLSYASIYLILSIAGKTNQCWICAGDTAQMISPGCSFTFDGLKQTMLAVQPGIESKLSTAIFHLLRNYRTTKDVLAVANKILNVAKAHFPDSIEYAMPEIAMKDLDLKVRLCCWDECLTMNASLGIAQAFIYSTDKNPIELESEANRWLGNHPFIVSSLESKGLEFDDIIVAFNHERKTWNISAGSAASLKMLRELYVAVTRAKRRVVILVQRSNKLMLEFFTKFLDCNLEFLDALTIIKEFNIMTSEKSWYEKGYFFFQDKNFKFAASCFSAAKSLGWSFWADGLHHQKMGQLTAAVRSFRRSAHHFLAENDYEKTLDMFRLVKDIPPWDFADNTCFEKARDMVPNYFKRAEVVSFALVRNTWAEITIQDVKSSSIAPLLYDYRTYLFIKSMLNQCSNEDRAAIKLVFPLAVGDWYLRKYDTAQAVKIYLAHGDRKQAEDVTVELARSFQFGKSETMLQDTIALCLNSRDVQNNARKGKSITLLLSLVQLPLNVEQSSDTKSLAACFKRLGGDFVKWAVRNAGLEDYCLHYFDKSFFTLEVISSLEKKYKRDYLQIMNWFIRNKDNHNAWEYCVAHIARMTDANLGDVEELKLSPSKLINQFEEQGVLLMATSAYLQINPPQVEYALEASRLALQTPKGSAVIKQIIASLCSATSRDFETKKGSLKSPQSKVSLFWALIAGDIEAFKETVVPKECFAAFGRKVVYQCVLNRGPSKTDLLSILCSFNLQAFEKTCRYTILQDLAKYGSSIHSLHYAEQLATCWSTIELNKILFEFKYRSEIIRQEIERRKLYFVCVKLCLLEGRASPAGIGNDDKIEISTKKEDDVNQLLKIWNRCDRMNVQSPCSAVTGCLMADLWNLWKCPWKLSPKSRSALIIHFGPIMTGAVANGKSPINLDTLKKQFDQLKKSLLEHSKTKAAHC